MSKSFADGSLQGAASKLPQVKPLIRIGILETSSVRLLGYRIVFEHESGFDLVSASLADMDGLKGIDLVILGNCDARPLFDLMPSLKITRPDLRIIVMGSGDAGTILKAIIAGAKCGHWVLFQKCIKVNNHRDCRTVMICAYSRKCGHGLVLDCRRFGPSRPRYF